MSLVLIVDDHEDTCRVMERLIRRLGPDAECVNSGAAALSFVVVKHPSLVLLDVTMPGMDGFETLERLRATPGLAAVPVVMFTAMTDERCRRRAFELGATDYWVKGDFDWAGLARMLGRFVPVSRPPPPPGRN